MSVAVSHPMLPLSLEWRNSTLGDLTRIGTFCTGGDVKAPYALKGTSERSAALKANSYVRIFSLD